MCGPVLLEPLMRVERSFRQSTSLGFTTAERAGYDVVAALVPQAGRTYFRRQQRAEVAPERAGLCFAREAFR